MSLLLEALKKAALEKQEREQGGAGQASEAEQNPVAEKDPAESSSEAEAMIADAPLESDIDLDISDVELDLSDELLELDETGVNDDQLGAVVAPVAEGNEASKADEAVSDDVMPQAVKSVEDKAPVEPSHEETSASSGSDAAPDSQAVQEQEKKIEQKSGLSDQNEMSSSEEKNDGSAALAAMIASRESADRIQKRRLRSLYILLCVTVTLVVAAYYYLLTTGQTGGFDSFSTNVNISQPLSASEDTVLQTTVDSKQHADEVISAVESVSVDASAAVTEKVEKKSAEVTVRKKVQRAEKKQPPRRLIVRNEEQVDPLSESIQRGYQAYQQGDYTAAQSAYEQALTLNADHKDAQLGAAAVAMRQERYQDAMEYYQQRLRRAPRDAYAYAGIIALSGMQSFTPALQSKLKELLEQHPEAAHLHFLQGVINSRQQQWSAAQSAFFEAVSRDNSNADYAFNFAVSLDHLGQHELAVRYYRNALSLTQKGSAGFSREEVQKRIESLEVKQ